MITIDHFVNNEIRTLTLKDAHRVLAASEGIVWIDLDDPSEAEEETVLVSLMDFHPLAVEDCQHGRESGHLPKVEDFGNYLFIIFNPLEPSVESAAASGQNQGLVTTTQLNTFLTRNVLVTHHYRPLQSLQRARELCSKNPMTLGRGPDFLFHVIIDDIVDGYSPILDRLDDLVDGMEDEVFERPNGDSLARILQLKRNIMTLRRIAVYQREMLNRLSRGEFELITREEMIYYRNVYDHLVRMSDLAESYRDIVSGLLDAYLSVTSNRLNQVMKILTIISTIFLPLGVVTGFFGMNLRNLPWAESDQGVALVTGGMVVIALLMLWYFRRKQWI